MPLQITNLSGDRDWKAIIAVGFPSVIFNVDNEIYLCQIESKDAFRGQNKRLNLLIISDSGKIYYKLLCSWNLGGDLKWVEQKIKWTVK